MGAFGIDPNSLNLSPAQILQSEQNRINLGLAEQRLSLEERAQSLREQAFEFETSKVPEKKFAPLPKPIIIQSKKKAELTPEETQTNRREKAEARIAKEESQKALAKKYGQAWEKTPEGKWREKPEIVEQRKLESAEKTEKMKVKYGNKGSSSYSDNDYIFGAI